MASLLSKFRLDYSSLQMVQISDKPKPKTVEFFNTIIEDFRIKDDNEGDGKCKIKEFLAKTNC